MISRCRSPPKQIAGKDLVAIRQATGSLPRFLSQNVLLLNNGDRVPVDVRKGWRLDQDRLYFRPAPPLQSTKDLDLSVNYVAVLCLGKGDADALDEQNSLLTKALTESRTRDVILFTDGDRVEGTLKNLDSVQGAKLDINGKLTPIPLARIKAIAFNTEFKARPRGKGPFAQTVLSNGARLGFSKLRLEAGKETLTGVTLFGPTVELPLAELRAIDIRQGPAVYLSDVAVSSKQTSYLNLAWPIVKDASSAGKPLQIGKDFFEKGIGMHSQSEAIYPLDGKYRWFETTVGMDERHGQMGRVRLRVLADKKELPLIGAGKEPAATSILCTRQDGPITLRLDVRGAKELILAVDFADFGDVQGHVNWGNARVIK
jgi:hypothetical protein